MAIAQVPSTPEELMDDFPIRPFQWWDSPRGSISKNMFSTVGVDPLLCGRKRSCITMDGSEAALERNGINHRFQLVHDVFYPPDHSMVQKCSERWSQATGPVNHVAPFQASQRPGFGTSFFGPLWGQRYRSQKVLGCWLTCEQCSKPLSYSMIYTGWLIKIPLLDY